MLINEIDKSLKKGPVIKKKGISENSAAGMLWNINFSFMELKIIDLRIVDIN